MITEIVLQVGEHPLGYLFDSHSLVIEGWSCHGEKDEDDVIEEERGGDDEDTTLELLISAEEIVVADKGYERIIRGISQVEQFCHYGIVDGFRVDECRLTAKQRLLPLCEEMIEVRNHLVQLIRIGIPPGKERQLYGGPYHPCKPAGYQSVNEVQGCCDGDDMCPEGEQCLWVIQSGIVDEDIYRGK